MVSSLWGQILDFLKPKAGVNLFLLYFFKMVSNNVRQRWCPIRHDFRRVSIVCYDIKILNLLDVTWKYAMDSDSHFSFYPAFYNDSMYRYCNITCLSPRLVLYRYTRTVPGARWLTNERKVSDKYKSISTLYLVSTILGKHYLFTRKTWPENISIEFFSLQAFQKMNLPFIKLNVAWIFESHAMNITFGKLNADTIFWTEYWD